MRKLIFSLIVLALYSDARSQFSVAFAGGPQITSSTPAFTLMPDTVLRSVSRYVGANFGFIGNVDFNRKRSLALRTGILYSMRGSKVTQYFDTVNVDITQGPYLVQATTNLKLNYIDVPVDLLLKLRIAGKTKFLLGGGIQGSLLLNGSTSFDAVKATKAHPDSAAILRYTRVVNNDLPEGSTTNQYQTLHFSTHALAGFEFGNAFFTVNYSNGLTGFFKSNDQSFTSQTIGLHFGMFLRRSHAKKIKPVKDKDQDGVTDDIDLCPDASGTALTKGCPDKDGDGIADKDDKCPGKAGTLENHGCPVPDKDNDGVRDEEDKCPDVAGSNKYGGCPVPDTDHDGVNDEEDKCPTVIGYKDNSGCPKATKELQRRVNYAAKKIQFEFKKTEISPSSFKLLDQVVDILKKNPTLKIRVEGHTSGPIKQSNGILSQQRADSVRDYFIKKGIDASRITAQGFGSSRHISKDGYTRENPIDRRVELIIF